MGERIKEYYGKLSIWLQENPRTAGRIIVGGVLSVAFMMSLLIKDMIKDQALPSEDYFFFPNQSAMTTSCPASIRIDRNNIRVWIGGEEDISAQKDISIVFEEEPRDIYERGYKVERLSDYRILVEIPRYPLTLNSTPPQCVDPTSSGRQGTYFDYDGPESNHLENKLRELIPLGLDKADDSLEITIRDNDGIKSVKVEEVDKTLIPIREIPEISDYVDSEEYKANFRELEGFEELVAKRYHKIGGVMEFSLGGRAIPEKRELRFGYDMQGIGDAYLLKVSVVDNFDISSEIYLELRRI